MLEVFTSFEKPVVKIGKWPQDNILNRKMGMDEIFGPVVKGVF